MSDEFEMTASKGGNATEKAPAGNHLAVLVGVFSIGTQENEFNGEITRSKRALFVYELVGEKVAGTKGNNHVIASDLTLSLHEKAKLRRWEEARTGKALPDGTKVDREWMRARLGQPCMLNVKLNGSGYPVIDSIAGVPKGVPTPQPTYPLTLTTLEDFKKDEACIPDWVPWLFGSPLSDHIKASVELGGSKPTRKSAPRDPLSTAGLKEGEPIPF